MFSFNLQCLLQEYLNFVGTEETEVDRVFSLEQRKPTEFVGSVFKPRFVKRLQSLHITQFIILWCKKEINRFLGDAEMTKKLSEVWEGLPTKEKNVRIIDDLKKLVHFMWRHVCRLLVGVAQESQEVAAKTRWRWNTWKFESTCQFDAHAASTEHRSATTTC